MQWFDKMKRRKKKESRKGLFFLESFSKIHEVFFEVGVNKVTEYKS